MACVGPTYNNTNPPYAAFKVLIANGVRLPQNTCTQYGTKYDAFTGAITKPFDNWANPHLHGVASVAVTEQYTFDAAGRLTNAVKSQGSPTTSYAASYDAENHLTGKIYHNTGIAGAYNGTINYTWGANGHPVQYVLNGTTDSIHWDGDTPLFLTDSSGALRQIFMSPGVLFSNATGAFTIQDFDWSGSLIAAHGASGSGNLIGTNYFGLGNTEWGPLPASNPIAFTRSDGFILGADTFQGVRTYNATSAQWNTPDAYVGEVGDPMSQKPYMWNRNNPVAYSDPSGYCAPECVPEILEGAGAVLQASAEAESAAIGASVIARAAPLSRAAEEAANFAKSPANTIAKLNNVATYMFRQSDSLPGGTANAVRYEIATGKIVGGRFHLAKGAGFIRALKKVLSQKGLSQEEKQATNALLKDLQDAYGPYDPDRFLNNNRPPTISPQVQPGPKPQQ